MSEAGLRLSLLRVQRDQPAWLMRWSQRRVNGLEKIMQSEIAEIPAVFTKLIAAESQFGALSNLLKTSQIKSVLVLARGTSDNAAHFLKYLIETQLGLPVGLTSPSSVTIYDAKLRYEGVLVVALS